MPVQVLNGKSDSFQMVKSQQQVSANQGRLDAFMTHSRPSTSAPAPATVTAAAPRSTAVPSASTAPPPVAMGSAPRPPAAPPAQHAGGRPSWVKAVPNNTAVSQHSAAPRDITNLPLTVGSGPAKGQQQHQTPHNSSPGKQSRLQSFFQPKQVANQQQQLQLSHGQQQLQLPHGRRQQPQQQQQPPPGQQQPHMLHGQQCMQAGSKHMQAAAELAMHILGAHNNVVSHQSDVQLNRQHPLAQDVPAQAGNHAWQQQHQQHQQQAFAHRPPTVKVSGVFADDDDFDDIWMSDNAFQAQTAVKAPAASVQQQQSIMAMPVIDLSGSPVHKKAKS